MERGADGRRGERRVDRVSFESLGTALGRLTAAFAAGFALSVAPLVGQLLLADGREPTIRDPLAGYLLVACVVGVTLSLLGYVAWSFVQYRRLRAEVTNPAASRPFENPVHLLAVLNGDPEELDRYERRARKTVAVLVVALIPLGVVLEVFGVV